MVIALLFLPACGVKGRPIPPDPPVEIGRGEPSFKAVTEGIQLRKGDKKPPGDWENEEDFPEKR